MDNRDHLLRYAIAFRRFLIAFETAGGFPVVGDAKRRPNGGGGCGRLPVRGMKLDINGAAQAW